MAIAQSERSAQATPSSGDGGLRFEVGRPNGDERAFAVWARWT